MPRTSPIGPGLLLAAAFAVAPTSRAADPLPGTKPLTDEGDLAAKMVAGIHKYLDRELASAAEKRKALWKLDKLEGAELVRAVGPHRERFRKQLGLVDPRLAPKLEYVGGPDRPALVTETERYKVFAVRWAVLPGVDGEGLLLEPKGPPAGLVVAIPDADQTPEMVCGLAPGVPPEGQFARHLADLGCLVVVPVLIDRKDDLSGNPKLGKATNQPHREFVHRMAYEMGRTLVGHEVQKVLAAVDWFQTRREQNRPFVGLYGFGEGGLIALYAAAADEPPAEIDGLRPLPRIKETVVSGYFGPREKLADEPIYRNVWGLLREFGDAELVALAGAWKHGTHVEVTSSPDVAGPATRPGRGGAAPGAIRPVAPDAARAEYQRIASIANVPNTFTVSGPSAWPRMAGTLRNALAAGGDAPKESGTIPKDLRKNFDPAARHKRQLDQLVAYTQKLWRDSDAVRKEFWKKADASSPEAWEKSCEWYRAYFHEEVIGKLPEPTVPLNPRTRQVYDEPKFTGHEVMLDVYPDVFAHGILLLPKDLKPGEKRPVVVCQHGLEGRPTDTINVEKRPVYNHFSRRLVELGYIVYAPQNPYIGQTTFRQIQRKAQPLKAALFSFIVRQHQRTIDWLETLPSVDPKRIAFYGLSYGGKTAMRVPAIEKRYCLSICSADFNEWVGKNVSVDLDRSYMWTVEYDMYEFDLGHTFNYAEMAYLIAPRPFMVERGHDDGVGTDEMVAYEFAKVRYLYQNRLKVGDRTAIEFFPGGHQINAKETFAFLKHHLGFPK